MVSSTLYQKKVSSNSLSEQERILIEQMLRILCFHNEKEIKILRKSEYISYLHKKFVRKLFWRLQSLVNERFYAYKRTRFFFYFKIADKS